MLVNLSLSSELISCTDDRVYLRHVPFTHSYKKNEALTCVFCILENGTLRECQFYRSKIISLNYLCFLPWQRVCIISLRDFFTHSCSQRFLLYIFNLLEFYYYQYIYAVWYYNYFLFNCVHQRRITLGPIIYIRWNTSVIVIIICVRWLVIGIAFNLRPYFLAVSIQLQ